jgi:hypothetical protein
MASQQRVDAHIIPRLSASPPAPDAGSGAAIGRYSGPTATSATPPGLDKGVEDPILRADIVGHLAELDLVPVPDDRAAPGVDLSTSAQCVRQ